jgi:hypothetical protein
MQRQKGLSLLSLILHLFNMKMINPFSFFQVTIQGQFKSDLHEAII